MRTRRRFQPMLDGLSRRIAPSTIGVVQPPGIAAAGVSAGHSLPICQPDDSEMPETGVLCPLILGPTPSTPPPTLVC